MCSFVSHLVAFSFSLLFIFVLAVFYRSVMECVFLTSFLPAHRWQSPCVGVEATLSPRPASSSTCSSGEREFWWTWSAGLLQRLRPLPRPVPDTARRRIPHESALCGSHTPSFRWLLRQLSTHRSMRLLHTITHPMSESKRVSSSHMGLPGCRRVLHWV